MIHPPPTPRHPRIHVVLVLVHELFEVHILLVVPQPTLNPKSKRALTANPSGCATMK